MPQPNSSDEAAQTREKLKLCLARKLWPIRDQLAPNDYTNPITGTRRPETWGQVFKRMHGISLEDFRAERKKLL